MARAVSGTVHGSMTALARAACGAALLLLAGTTPAHALKVAAWNLLDYPNTNLAARQPKFRTVIAGLNPDILMVQELKSAAGADSFRIDVLGNALPGRVWKDAGFLSATESTIFYDSALVTVNIPTAIADGGPRQVYQLLVSPRGYTAGASKIRMYSIHFKAGNPSITPADSTTRRVECTNLRNTFNAAPAGTNILMGGDTNFYGDWEGGYARLTEHQLDDDGRLKDLYTMPGTWNQFDYRCYHTQCPCLTGCGPGQSGGGMDDRFDLFLTTAVMQDGQGVDLVGYTAYGNDCGHYNDDINGSGFNTAVPISIANAEHDASDHIPVLVTLQLPSAIAAASALDFGTVIVGATAQQTLTVTNSATGTVDDLTYSFAAPADFSAPSGTFNAAGGTGNPHTISMSTADAGVRSGTLTVNSDAVDSLAKLVLLSGKVFDHASPSLDSAGVLTARTVDFAAHLPGGFRDTSVRVFNTGYNALQAKLSLSGATITGGGGRFSIVGGFTSGLLGTTGKTYNLHFDDTGATLDQTYEATLTFNSSDEALPGGTPLPGLSVTLRARPVTTLDAPDGTLPQVLAFLPARPNPLSRGTELGFDLPKTARVALEIYDLSGRRVATLIDGAREAGRHRVRWNAVDAGGAPVEAGLYFARFSAPGFIRTQRLIFLP